METVRRCYEFWANRDYSFIEEVTDPDLVIDLSRNELNPDVYSGHDGFRRWVRSVEEIWEEFTVTRLTGGYRDRAEALEAAGLSA